MRMIIIEDEGDRLVLGTPEFDRYINLSLSDHIADTSRLDDNTCQKMFACSAKDLRNFLRKKGY